MLLLLGVQQINSFPHPVCPGRDFLCGTQLFVYRANFFGELVFLGMQGGAFCRIVAAAQSVLAVGAPGFQSLHFLSFLRDESLHFLPGLQRISLQQMQLGFDLLPVAQIPPAWPDGADDGWESSQAIFPADSNSTDRCGRCPAF